MATLESPRPLGPVINYDEPAIKKPPIFAVGPLAWIRENLFSSVFDATLTVLLAIAGFVVIAGIINWAVASANWFVVIQNIKLYTVGFFPDESVWRLYVFGGFIAFIVGFSLAAWGRISRVVLALIIALTAFTILAPPIIRSSTNPAPAFFAVGNTAIASGTVTETPQRDLAFIAAEGDEIRIEIANLADSRPGQGEIDGIIDETAEALEAALGIELADEARESLNASLNGIINQSADELALVNLSGFGDRASNALVNKAANRLDTRAEIVEITQRLAGDRITDAQRADLTAELEGLELPLSITEEFALNQSPVTVEILDGQSLELLVSQTLTPGDVLTFEIPADGWYDLRKFVAEDAESTALLRVENIYALVPRSFSRTVEAEDGSTTTGFVDNFARLTDDFETEDARPVIEDDEVPMAQVIDNQYRGERSFNDYLRLILSPFLDLINIVLLGFVVIAAAGYAASILFNQNRPRPHPTNTYYAAQWLALRLWGIFPLVFLIAIVGTGSRLWGGLLLTFILTVFGIVVSFPIGIAAALGRRSSLPVVKTVSVLYIELVRGVPLITVLFMANLMLPLVHPSLASIDPVIRVTVGIILFTGAYLAENVRGGLQSIPPGQEEAAKAVGLNNFQVLYYITLPQALRAVIPAMVGMFIGLFKDTSLVVIVGLTDLVGSAQTSINQSEFAGRRTEAFVFIAIIYFIFSYIMSVVSRRIEASGAGAATQRL